MAAARIVDQDLLRRPFPATQWSGESESQSHRRLTLLGNEIRGAWTDHRQYYVVRPQEGVLHCNQVWWVEIGGSISNVPAGCWDVDILLRYDYVPYKTIDWSVRVEDSSGVVGSTLNLQTTPSAGGANFDPNNRGIWVRYRMGTLSAVQPNSRVFLAVHGYDDMITDFSYGGMELKPWSVEPRKEVLLARMAFSNGGRAVLDERAIVHAEQSPLLQLPQNVALHIAQYLITPMPDENLLINNRDERRED